MMAKILVEKEVINNIIQLAERRADAESRLPNEVDLTNGDSISEALVSTKEDETLYESIENLSLEQARELLAIMDFGRDDSDTSEAERALDIHRNSVETMDFDSVKQSLHGKIPLAKYLLAGLEKLNNS